MLKNVIIYNSYRNDYHVICEPFNSVISIVNILYYNILLYYKRFILDRL